MAFNLEEAIQAAAQKAGQQAFYTKIAVQCGDYATKINLPSGKGLSYSLIATDAKQALKLARYPLQATFVNKLWAERQRIQEQYLTPVSKNSWLLWEEDLEDYLKAFFEMQTVAEDMRQQLLEGYEEARESYLGSCRTLVVGAYFDELYTRLGEEEMSFRLAAANTEIGQPDDTISVESMELVLHRAGVHEKVEAKMRELESSFVTIESINNFGVSIEAPRPIPSVHPEDESLTAQAVKLELEAVSKEAFGKFKAEVESLQEATQKFVTAEDYAGFQAAKSLHKRYAEALVWGSSLKNAFQLNVSSLEEMVLSLNETLDSFMDGKPVKSKKKKASEAENDAPIAKEVAPEPEVIQPEDDIIDEPNGEFLFNWSSEAVDEQEEFSVAVSEF